MAPVIEVEHLVKRYGDAGVDDISLTVEAGEIFGVLGPNGAGKTTLVECIHGLRKPDGGSVRIHGLDPQRDKRVVQQTVGVQLQESALQDGLKVREALELFAAFYDDPADPDALLLEWGLADKRAAKFETLSGGQRQRLFIALALVHKPTVVFLDELTAGLDPYARREAWDMVRSLRDRGVTVVLVTHFMDEVEALCDRVMVVDHGSVITTGTPDELKLAGESLEDAFLRLTGHLIHQPTEVSR